MADNDIRSPFAGALERIRATDPRVDPVIRCLVAYRMGWSQDDPVDQVVPLVLDSMVAGSVVVAAKRLLERLDAMEVRELAGFYGEDAVFEAMSRVDDRVRTLTAERDFYRAAWEADRDGSAQPPDGTGA